MIKVQVKVKNDENKIETISFVSASTKSKNIVYKKLEEKDICIYHTTEKVEEFYIDREVALEKAKELSATIKNLDKEEQELLTSAILGALEVGCLVKRLQEEEE